MKIVVLFVVLFAAVIVRCQDILEEDVALNSDIEERSDKEKRGIALNLGGSGLEGYSYFGPTSRGLRGYGGSNFGGYNGNQIGGYTGSHLGGSYAPMADYGYDGVNYGMGAQNFAGGFQGGYGGYNQPFGSYPYGGYRGGIPTSYSNFRLSNSPINTYPLGGIGTVGPYGGAYGGINNRLGGIGGVDGLYQPGPY